MASTDLSFQLVPDRVTYFSPHGAWLTPAAIIHHAESETPGPSGQLLTAIDIYQLHSDQVLPQGLLNALLNNWHPDIFVYQEGDIKTVCLAPRRSRLLCLS
jgi:hypothetical protein